MQPTEAITPWLWSSLADVRRALPHLTLWHVGFMELDLLQLIGWRATIWEASEWTASRLNATGRED